MNCDRINFKFSTSKTASINGIAIKNYTIGLPCKTTACLKGVIILKFLLYYTRRLTISN